MVSSTFFSYIYIYIYIYMDKNWLLSKINREIHNTQCDIGGGDATGHISGIIVGIFL